MPPNVRRCVLPGLALFRSYVAVVFFVGSPYTFAFPSFGETVLSHRRLPFPPPVQYCLRIYRAGGSACTPPVDLHGIIANSHFYATKYQILMYAGAQKLDLEYVQFGKTRGLTVNTSYPLRTITTMLQVLPLPILQVLP